ncbi:cystatin-like fold lipoprotein [Geomicrobium sediminis]|uniref:DUF4467 domain-containing protein n=1 Tax=Geomicrobium sediminis TaxID=1347788 RepID=A0ABS2PG63_9BACL|nr:cystatin-like fold lipoprotein [Geomicrobium sediminis]MBM7634418.1 hypothetical protein [Geomicrobium sediminis]
MKGFLRLTFIVPFFLIVVGCGENASGSEYDELLDAVAEYHYDRYSGANFEGNARENADLTVWENGRYVRIGFFNEDDGSLMYETYYEIVADNIERKDGYGENAVMSKEPEYQEQMGEEL